MIDFKLPTILDDSKMECNPQQLRNWVQCPI